MRSPFIKAALSVAGTLCASAVLAQAPGVQPGPGSIVVAKPTYTALIMEVEVNRPAADVWKRVGKYCDIGEWLQVPCTITSGKDGEVGSVRSIGREILVGKTDLSYTYTQPVTEGFPYIQYHGTLEAKPVSATTSKLVYTLMWDNSPLADDAIHPGLWLGGGHQPAGAPGARRGRGAGEAVPVGARAQHRQPAAGRTGDRAANQRPRTKSRHGLTVGASAPCGTVEAGAPSDLQAERARRQAPPGVVEC